MAILAVQETKQKGIMIIELDDHNFPTILNDLMTKINLISMDIRIEYVG